MIWDVIVCIAKDLCQPLFYLCVIAAVGILFLWFRLIYGKLTGNCYDWRRLREKSARLLLVVYILVLLQTAFFSREPGSRQSLDLTLFETWGHSAVSHAYFIENILMYLPFGVLMPCCFGKMQRGVWCVALGCCSSALLELCQLLTRRGYCQLDDVLTNTAGALFGWFLWKLWISIFKKSRC